MAHCKNASRKQSNKNKTWPQRLLITLGMRRFQRGLQNDTRLMPLFARKAAGSSFLAANLWSCEEGRLRRACGCSGQACGSRNRINGNMTN